MSEKTFQYKKQFKLESGKRIKKLNITYHTYGKLNADKSNVVWVCHALTANSDVFDWWKGLFGKTDFFNPKEYFIVCANVLGSPYGTVNPLSVNETTKQPYYLSFPKFSVRDMVEAHKLLAEHLELKNIEILIGGSLGGQQALEWTVSEADRIKNLIVLATNAQHSPWGIAFNESQRLAIETDRTFYGQEAKGGQKGLKTARSIALLSYRTYDCYETTQAEESHKVIDLFKASSYQNYQGEKLVKRFNAYSYWYLTKAMDSHNLGRGRASIEMALASISAKTLVIGITSDILFPTHEQKFLVEHIPLAEYQEINSLYGHDGFLLEVKQLKNIIAEFLKGKTLEKKHSSLKIA